MNIRRVCGMRLKMGVCVRVRSSTQFARPRRGRWRKSEKHSVLFLKTFASGCSLSFHLAVDYRKILWGAGALIGCRGVWGARRGRGCVKRNAKLCRRNKACPPPAVSTGSSEFVLLCCTFCCCSPYLESDTPLGACRMLTVL